MVSKVCGLAKGVVWCFEAGYVPAAARLMVGVGGRHFPPSTLLCETRRYVLCITSLQSLAVVRLPFSFIDLDNVL